MFYGSALDKSREKWEYTRFEFLELTNMDIDRITNCIGKGAFADAENAWMAGIKDNPSPEKVNQALTAFLDAGKEETAETLGWSLLEAHANAPKEQTLALASAALLAVPKSEELRNQTAELFKEVYAAKENFEKIYKAAGLETGQSPKRAIRTLNTCLALKPGMYMGNRFDGRVIKITGLNVMGEFEYHDFAEKSEDVLEPKLLADEFDVLDETDFRVLQQNPEEMEKMMQKDIGRVLVGMCIANSGEINSDQLKERLIPKYLPASKWTSWWGRARTAAKKSEKLTLEGRNPVTVVYHATGRSLEEEYRNSEEFKSAYHPIDCLVLLRNYIRDAAARGQAPDEKLTGQITTMIAQRVAKCIPSLPNEALEGVLVLALAKEMGISIPAEAADLPTPADILGHVHEPASSVAGLPDADLWAGAIKAIKGLANAADIFEKLLYLSPVEQLDVIAENLKELGRPNAAGEAIAKAMNFPIKHIDLCLWVWLADAGLVEDQPGKLTILMKILDMSHEIDHNWHGDNTSRKDARQKVRNALAARDYAIYQAALDEADEAMGSVVKTKIERTDGLAQAVNEQLINRLRDKFFSLFVKAKALPWEDESVIWTTDKALEAHQEEMRILKEVTMPANAKQIGEAAEAGDLRENADWQAAIEERDMLVARARKIQNELLMARVIHVTDVPKDSVSVGSKVTLKRVSDGKTFEMSFLGPWDSDTDNNIYAYTTRLAQNLMGKALGETLTLELEGQEDQFTIDALAPAGV